MDKLILPLFALLICSCQKESETGDHRIIKEEDFEVISLTSKKRYFEQIINPSNIGLVGRIVLISEAWRVPEQHPRMHIIDSKDWAMVEQRAGRRGLKPVTLGALPSYFSMPWQYLSWPHFMHLQSSPHFNNARYFTRSPLVRKTLLELEQRRTLEPLFHNFLFVRSV